jgi:hypothetical protein
MKGCLRHHISNIANLTKYAYRLIMPLEQHYKIGGKKKEVNIGWVVSTKGSLPYKFRP